MAFNFEACLKYPYRSDNRKNALLIPGIIYLVSAIVILGVQLGYMGVTLGGNLEAMLDPSYPSSAEYKQFQIISAVISLPFSFLFGSISSGYLWRLIDTFQRDGLQATAPGWDDFAALFMNGFKLQLYFFLWTIPVFILSYAYLFIEPAETAMVVSGIGSILSLVYYIVMFFLSPFVFASIALSASSKSIGTLFNLPGSLSWATQKYGSFLISMLIYFAMAIVYAIGGIFVACMTGCLGLPFITAALMTSFAYLIVSGFETGNTEQAQPV